MLAARSEILCEKPNSLRVQLQVTCLKDTRFLPLQPLYDPETHWLTKSKQFVPSGQGIYTAWLQDGGPVYSASYPQMQLSSHSSGYREEGTLSFS